MSLCISFDEINQEYIHYIYNDIEQIKFIKIMYTTPYTTLNNITTIIWNNEIMVPMILQEKLRILQNKIFSQLKLSFQHYVHFKCFIQHAFTSIINIYSMRASNKIFLKIYGISLQNEKMTISYKVF